MIVVEPNFNLPEGFELREEDDHFVYLYHNETFIAIFNATRVSPIVIEKACLEHLGKEGLRWS